MKGIRKFGKYRCGALVSVLCLAWVGCEDKNPVKTGEATEKPEPYGVAAEEAGSKTPSPSETEPEITAAPKTDSVPGGSEGQAIPDASPKPEPEAGSRGKVEQKAEKNAESAAPAAPWTVADAGFASRLPAATDYYFDARNLGEIWRWLEEMGVLEKGRNSFLELLEESSLPEEVRALLSEGTGLVPDLLGEEVFLAGQGMAWTWETAAGVNTLMSRVFGKAIAGKLAAGNMDFFDEEEDLAAEMVNGVGKWIESQLEKSEGMPKVSLYAGGRVSDARRRAEVVKMVQSLFSLAVVDLEPAKEITFKRGGVEWSGFEVKIETVENLRAEDAPDGIEAEVWQYLMKQVGKWSVVVACAEVGDYVVMAAGNGQESIEVVDDVGASLAGAPGFRFFEQFPAEEVASLGWWSRDLSAASQTGISYLPFFEGALDGLRGSKLERVAQMVEALKDFNRHWGARRAGKPNEFSGVLLVGEEIRLEGRGGWLGSGLDLEIPSRFAKAFSALEKVPFVRAHWTMNADYVRNGNQQVDSGMRLLRLIVEEVMDALVDEMEGDEEGREQAVRWKRDLSKGLNDIWRGYREHFSGAFGKEGAFVMDLQGEMIPAIGVEEDVIRKGRIPRAAYIKPVVKREALSESWDIWEKAFTNLFGVLAETVDQPIPFPSTMTAEKDDLRTYFFPMPFATDDFLPSVSVSDDLYILGSSKVFSESLYEAALKAKGEREDTGFRVEVDAGQLWDFCRVWIDFYEESRAEAEGIEEDELNRDGRLLPEPGEDLDVPPEEGAEPDFDPDDLGLQEAVPFGGLFAAPDPELLRGWLDRLRILRGIRFHRRLEEGVPRATLRIRIER